MDWLIALGWGILRLFAQPLLYLFAVLLLVRGLYRVKRERRSFHTRIQDLYEEWKFAFSKGLLAGLLLSVITIGLGLLLPNGSIMLLALVTAVIGLTFQLRFLSAAYTVGLTFFAAVLLNSLGGGTAQQYFTGLNHLYLPALVILLSLLLIAEGYLILRSGFVKTSPNIVSSSRGLPIGNHLADKTWMLPVFLLIPGDVISANFSWWPVFDLAGQSFTFLLVPFFIGFHQRVQGSLPRESIQVTGKRVMWLGALILVISLTSIWWIPISYLAAVLAIAGREAISIRQRMNDNAASFYFSKRDKGLVILGILPGSPADKMGLKVGEMVMKANGISVKTPDEFYAALQKNGAFCKLELISLNGEIRYAQRALYEGEHYELGILFVEDAKKGKHKAV
ncbi:PDZ domain-containing protein [Metabacillus sp. GX 13764]|uniref:PDZ domain-containing protein n=1 Tax=Metabacillus kandeliae TaxID=2900151 RepID=UPI001E3D5C1C|nr:PDZ domain-containing protein [Metabacillus kandeliae]MCD7035958.1 PDZ domain-containing protein [Metabacillus kandeliae]